MHAMHLPTFEELTRNRIEREEARLSSEERAQRELARQTFASEMWTAAFAADVGLSNSKKALVGEGGSAGAPGASSPLASAKTAAPAMNMTEFMAICCACKLVIMPALCIGVNAILFRLGAIHNVPILRLMLDIYPAVPTAAALVARFAGAGYDDAARYCATTMLPMYLLSIPSLAIVIVLSSSLIGDAEEA